MRHVPRNARAPLLDALGDSPVVLLHGPRQCGKTTLARGVGDGAGYRYLTFDQPALAAAARADPVRFVDELPDRTVLDEVQRVPALFGCLKAAVDRDRRPGRFLLTGSVNVLLVPDLGDSLAGRMDIVRLHPLAQSELSGVQPAFLEHLFAARFPVRPYDRLRAGLAARVAAGGYPAALARARPGARARWYRNFVDTQLQRDVRDLARIQALDAIPRLLTVAANQTARLLNAAALAGPLQLSRPTVREYVTLLERVFLLDLVPPWHHNRLRRLVKTPKVHLGDTGVACAVLGLDAAALEADRTALGPLVETFVFQELRRAASWRGEPLAFHHYRDRDGVEVDIVIERGGREVAAIEVKAGATVTTRDFRGLRKLRAAAGKRFVCGVVLHDGEASVPFGDRCFAVPIRALWEPA